MTTHEVEEMLGITKQTLIYYEKEGFITPQRDSNNYRNYLKKELDMLELVLLLRSMEISIDEIKLILNNQLSNIDYLKKKSTVKNIEIIKNKKFNILFETKKPYDFIADIN